MSTEYESSYTCPSCGEEIHVPVEVGEGREQEYVEDCPVCCCPILMRVRVFEDGSCRIDAELE